MSNETKCMVQCEEHDGTHEFSPGCAGAVFDGPELDLGPYVAAQLYGALAALVAEQEQYLTDEATDAALARAREALALARVREETA